MELEAFLRGLGLEPNDWDLRKIAADWCDDNGQAGRAECLRWMVRQQKRPYRGSSDAACWFNADKVKGELGDIESDIPERVYLLLEGGEESANHKTFPSLRHAEEAFHVAWVKAVVAGWVAEGGEESSAG